MMKNDNHEGSLTSIWNSSAQTFFQDEVAVDADASIDEDDPAAHSRHDGHNEEEESSSSSSSICSFPELA